jgi:formate-dependent nitrite reductase membrane component NrfD
VSVRRPEKETRPKLFYKGAHAVTLDPLAARRPDGGLFLWSEQGSLPHQVTSGHPGAANSSAAALLAYDIPHRMPWDWRLSLYTWTKGIAAGAYLVPLMLVLAGLIPAASPLWRFAAPTVAGAFLGLTGLILIADLEHPERFWLIFARPQWRSWLVRGAFVIAGYAAVLALHFLASFLEAGEATQGALAIAGLPLAALTAVYTAYLFAQAKARDLWQNPLLPPHFLVQAVLAGSASMMPIATAFEPLALAPLAWILCASSLLHLLFGLGEITLTHPTAHARLAVEEMTTGTYRRYFWFGAALVAMAVVAPWFGAPAAVPALAGLLAYEHAYVQAGQSVPLA